MGWLGWSKAIMTGKCQGQPEQFSWVDDLSHFCYKSGQVRYGQLTVFGITAVYEPRLEHWINSELI